MNYDPDKARGPLAPGPILRLQAWNTLQEVRKLGHMLERKIFFSLLDGAEKDGCLVAIDQALSYAETLIVRHDRNGPPVGNTELDDMQAVLRMAAKNPDQFKMLDIKSLKLMVEKLTQPKKK